MKLFFPAIALLLTITGCAQHMTLPYAKDAKSACALVVSDERPQPNTIYARSIKDNLHIEVSPPIAVALSSSACSKLTPAQAKKQAQFIVTEFSCTSSGVLEKRYLVDIRGRLMLPGHAPKNLQASIMGLTNPEHILKGCEETASLIPDMLSDEIVKSMGAE